MILQTPTISDFQNATHNHESNSGGGVLSGYSTISQLVSVSGDLYTIVANASGACAKLNSSNTFGNYLNTFTDSVNISGNLTIASIIGTSGNIVTHDDNGKLLDSGILVTSLATTSSLVAVSGNLYSLIASTSGSGGTTNHALLSNLDYTNASHTGFASSASLVAVSGNLYSIIASTSGSGGGVTKSGTPIDNQLAIWTSSTNVEGDANLTWSGSILGITGSINTSLPSVSGTATGWIENDLVAESVTFGNILYISGGQWAKSDADFLTKMPALRMALETKSAGQSCSLLISGRAWSNTWSWTVGGMIYASTDAGGITQTIPSGTTDIVQVIGAAYHANKMIFNPSMDMMEIQ